MKRRVLKTSKKLKKVKNYNKHRDSLLTAEKGGKRRSKTGKIYYESRENRADRHGKSKKGKKL